MKKCTLILLIIQFVFYSVIGQSRIQKSVNAIKANTPAFKISPFNDNSNWARIAGNVAERKFFKPNAKPVYLSLKSKMLKEAIAQKPQLLELSMPIGGNKTLDLELIPVNIFAQDFKVINGNNAEVPYTKGTFYHGVIKGSVKSLVAISVINGEISGIICDSLGNRNIEKIKSGVNDYIMYLDNSLTKKPEFKCSTIDVPITKGARINEINSASGVGCKVVNIYMEADYAFYQKHNSSVTATTDFITTLFNEVASLYRNENITIQMSSLRVWDIPDPYSSASTMEGTLKLMDSTLQQNFIGDIAHLISGKKFGGGISNPDMLCNKARAHGVSADNRGYYFPQSYSNFAGVIAHELGHSLGSRHTHACVWNGNNTAIDNCGPTAGYPYEGNCSGAPTPTNGGTIMSYCSLVNGVGVNFINGFGTQPGDLIRSKVSYASCLSTNCSSCTDQFEPNNTVASATNVFAQPLNSSISNYTLQGNIGFVDDVDWYKVDIGNCGTLTINLSNLPYNYDIELYNSDGTSFLRGSYNTSTTNEQITYSFTGSSTVKVKVYSVTPTNYTTASCYNLQFLWNPCSGCLGPSNDLCGNAILLTPLSICSYTNGTTCGATAITPANISTCFVSPDIAKDVWYKFTANQTNATVSVQSGNNFDAIVQVLSQVVCASSYTQVQCVNNTGIAGLETVALTGLTIGNTYWIRVYNNTGLSGTDFQICVTATAPVQTYTISTSSNPSNGGTTSGAGTYPPTYPSGQPVTVNAISNPGYSFVNWTENSSQITTNASYTFNVTGSRNLVANFTTCSYALDHYSTSIPANAFTGDLFWLNTTATCPWTGTTNGCSWITLNNPTGVGTTLINVSISANTSTSPRTCTIIVGGQTFTVTQVGFVAPCSSPPSDPNGLTANISNSNQIYLSWSGTYSNVTQCEIERSLSASGPFTLIGYSTNYGSYPDNNVVGGATYYYRVRACCNSNCSNYTNVASQQACTFSTKPTGIIASVTNICIGQSINLTVQGGSLGTGAVWTWRSTQCGSGPIVGTGSTTITVSPNASGYYVVKPEGGGCEISIPCAVVYITVNQLPTAPTISASGATSFCSGNSNSVILSGNNGGTWSNGATTPTITVNTSGDYFVINTNPCGTTTSNHIPVTVFLPLYTFTGTGNWDVSSNWSNNAIPPAILPACSEIVINPTIGGECVLNVPQIISAGAKLTVVSNKKFIIMGNLTSQ